MPSYLKDYHHIELFVHSAKMYAYWHTQVLGFKIIGYKGLETGSLHQTSYLLQKNHIRLIFTSFLSNSSQQVPDYLQLHPSGVHTLAFEVVDWEMACQEAFRSNLELVQKNTLQDENGVFKNAIFRLQGDMQLVLVDSKKYSSSLLPEFIAVSNQDVENPETYLQEIDHITVAFPFGESDSWRKNLQNLFEFDEIQTFLIPQPVQNGSGIMLKVLQDKAKKLTQVLVEPESNEGNSQVKEFVRYHKGIGVQHIALRTDDIFATLDRLKTQGVELMNLPHTYYDIISQDAEIKGLDLEKLKKYGVLCERTDDSFLLQVFTKPLEDTPTFFYEIVQRINFYNGFGASNVSALMQAYDLEKEKRTK